MGPSGPYFELVYLVSTVMRVGLALGSLLCIRAF